MGSMVSHGSPMGFTRAPQKGMDEDAWLATGVFCGVFSCFLIGTVIYLREQCKAREVQLEYVVVN